MILHIPHFNLRHTLLSGQCFEWEQVDEKFVGVIFNTYFSLSQVKDKIYIFAFPPMSDGQIESMLFHYFHLDASYENILESLEKDAFVAKAINKYFGLRLVKQPRLSCFVSFMLSANNSIANVKAIRNKLSAKFGVFVYEDTTSQQKFYSFPSLSSLKQVEENDWREIKAGYRAPHVFRAVQRMEEHFLENLAELSYAAAKKELVAFKGIGEKVADCILLYAYPFDNIYPTDTWVKKFTQKLYFPDTKISEKHVRAFGVEHFDGFAGWAQLFLYIYFREKKSLEN